MSSAPRSVGTRGAARRHFSERTPFLAGIETLLCDHHDWLVGQRVGLVSHAAAVDREGITSAERLWRDRAVNLTALLGPEHGYAGTAGAGEATADAPHATWGIPVFSLYGVTKRPTPEMLARVDVLVIDLQDLGARPYTYVSTLRCVLEAAAAGGKSVIVADRPVPLAVGTDGPLLEPAFESFVGSIRAPMQYGMTLGETALWLKSDLDLGVDLRVAPMRNYRRDPLPGPDWPPWVPPSPRIRSWEAACCFTATVAGEALPALDYGSGTDGLSFQVFGSPWIKSTEAIAALDDLGLPGVAFEPCAYLARTGLYSGTALDGVRIRVTDPAVFRPVLTGVSLLACLQRLYGQERLWNAAGTRPEFFDKLFGTDTVRHALLDGESGATVSARWHAALAVFGGTRASVLLYTPANRLSPEEDATAPQAGNP
jgi:uncharacterized protein YbbC (DUF1343 family)